MTQDHRPFKLADRKNALTKLMREAMVPMTARDMETRLGWHPGTASPALVSMRKDGAAKSTFIGEVSRNLMWWIEI